MWNRARANEGDERSKVLIVSFGESNQHKARSCQLPVASCQLRVAHVHAHHIPSQPTGTAQTRQSDMASQPARQPASSLASQLESVGLLGLCAFRVCPPPHTSEREKEHHVTSAFGIFSFT